jgi:hypothetical protein
VAANPEAAVSDIACACRPASSLCTLVHRRVWPRREKVEEIHAKSFDHVLYTVLASGVTSKAFGWSLRIHSKIFTSRLPVRPGGTKWSVVRQGPVGCDCGIFTSVADLARELRKYIPSMPNRPDRSIGLTRILGNESTLTKSPGRLTSFGAILFDAFSSEFSRPQSPQFVNDPISRRRRDLLELMID